MKTWQLRPVTIARCVLVVVGGAEADAPAASETQRAAVDGASVEAARDAEWMLGRPAFWSLGPDLGRVSPTDPSMGSLVVVDETEPVELGLEFLEGLAAGCLRSRRFRV